MTKPVKRLIDHFSPAALDAAADRTYDVPHRFRDTQPFGYVCQDGTCLLATLVKIDYPDRYAQLLPADQIRPDCGMLMDLLGYNQGDYTVAYDEDHGYEMSAEYVRLEEELDHAILANDKGRLKTRRQVAVYLAELADR